MNLVSRVCVSFYTPVLQSLASSIMPWKEDDTARWKWFLPCLPHKEPSQPSLQKLPIPPILLGAKRALFQSWSGSFFERLSLTRVVVSFPEKWEQKHLWNINVSHTLSGRERKLTTSHLLHCEGIILMKSCKFKWKKKKKEGRSENCKDTWESVRPRNPADCKLRTTAGRWERNSLPWMVDLKY